MLLTFTLPTKRASQRVEIWRKLQRYGTVPLGNSGYLLPSDVSNEERFQWLATTIRKYGGEASVVRVKSIDNLSPPRLKGQFSEARNREYQELIRQIQAISGTSTERKNATRLSRLRNRFQEIVDVDFFDSHSLAVDLKTHRVYTPEQKEDGRPAARMVVYEAVANR
jgi:Protein ChrB, N-terminal